MIFSNTSLRSVLQDKIYTVNHPDTGKEVEVVIFIDLINAMGVLCKNKINHE